MHLKFNMYMFQTFLSALISPETAIFVLNVLLVITTKKLLH